MTDKPNSRLPEFIRRLENMDEEIGALREDRKAIVDEAKADGFDAKALARLIRDRRAKEKNPDKFRAENDAYDVYANSLDLFA